MNEFPPRHVCVVACLTVAVGVASVLKMISGIVLGTFILDIGFLAIPIGHGMLRGKEWARTTAMIFFSLSLLGSVLVFGFVAYEYLIGSGRFAYPDYILWAILTFTLLLVCIYSVTVLRGGISRSWFKTTVENQKTAKSIAVSVAVVVIIVLVPSFTLIWWISETSSKLYSVNKVVKPFDEETGKPVTSLMTNIDYGTSWNLPVTGWQQIGTGYTTTEDSGVYAMFTGFAVRPFEVVIRSKGFEPVRLKINSNSVDEIEVPMKRSDAPIKEGDWEW